MKILAEMLTYRRAHDSAGEAEFIERFILPLDPSVIADKQGTVHAYTVTVPGNKRALFAAHTDSVHNRTLPATRQTIGFDTERQEFFVNNPKQRDCLGADDAAGVYVLTEMIAAQVPGTYMFFRGEERGGIGSGYVADHRCDLLDGFDYAIQFDRRGTSSIITQMMVGRTCSDAFARSLADVLGMGHKPDPTGSFTDTANLSAIIPECTNISIGYENEHSQYETLDAGYLLALTAAMIRTFAEPPKLTLERDPDQPATFDYVSLLDLDDMEIADLVEFSDNDTLTAILIAAREEIANASF